MKKTKYILHFSLLLSLAILLGCERDDICAEGTPTTPRLLIQFYDVANSDNIKSVTRLTAYGEGLVTDDAGNPIEPTEASSAIIEDFNTEGTFVFNTNEDIIALPLRVGEDGVETETRYVLERDTNLRLDTDDTTESNVDIITITYTPRYEYVSRACGFKSEFDNLMITIEPDADNWISSVFFPNTTQNNINVENENETQVRLLH